ILQQPWDISHFLLTSKLPLMYNSCDKRTHVQQQKSIAHIPSILYQRLQNTKVIQGGILMNHTFGMLSLYVQDIEKSKAFYTEFLGLKLLPAFSGPGFVFLQPTEGTPIALQDTASLP